MSREISVKQELYEKTLGIALAKLQQEGQEISPQLLSSVVSLLKLDETNITKASDNKVMSSFIDSIITKNK